MRCKLEWSITNQFLGSVQNEIAEPEAVFLVLLGTSSFPAMHEVYGKTTENLVPSMTKNTASGYPGTQYVSTEPLCSDWHLKRKNG